MAAKQLTPLAAHSAAGERIGAIDGEVKTLRQQLDKLTSDPVGVDEYSDAVMQELQDQAARWSRKAGEAVRSTSGASSLVPIEGVGAIDGAGRMRWRTSTASPADLFGKVQEAAPASPVVALLAIMGDQFAGQVRAWVQDQARAAGCVKSPAVALQDRTGQAEALRAQIEGLISERDGLHAQMIELQTQIMAASAGQPLLPSDPRPAPAPSGPGAPVVIDGSVPAELL